MTSVTIQCSESLVSTAIPYVNSSPHLGFALETVVADALARSRRLQGRRVHHQSGTDDNSLKNAQAAERRGISTAELVEANAAQFARLPSVLNLSWDEFVRTSASQVHASVVGQLWRRCQARGDIYCGTYEGLYCVGCEHYYVAGELANGSCPEHGVPPERVREDNYFFRLSRYQAQLRRLVSEDRIRIVPHERKREVLRLIDAGLPDFSVSRSRQRARDWGLLVPGDDSQVIYVWFDALANYISGLGECGFQRWANAERIEHVIGKGILRFHAVYWPAILLSAGLRLPTDILVHGYLTVEGRKIGKSLGNAIDPEAVVREFGVDPVRYFLLRHVHTTRDGDFSRERLRTAHDAELADQLGNLVQRTVSLIQSFRGGKVPAAPAPGAAEAHLEGAVPATAQEVARALERFALHEAVAAIWRLVALGNRYVDDSAPWKLGKAEAQGVPNRELDQTLYTLADLIRCIALLLAPFLPQTSRAILQRVGAQAEYFSLRARELSSGVRVTPGAPLFPKHDRSRKRARR
jgi:methionyl-tRNA synthetase